MREEQIQQDETYAPPTVWRAYIVGAKEGWDRVILEV